MTVVAATLATALAAAIVGWLTCARGYRRQRTRATQLRRELTRARTQAAQDRGRLARMAHQVADLAELAAADWPGRDRQDRVSPEELTGLWHAQTTPEQPGTAYPPWQPGEAEELAAWIQARPQCQPPPVIPGGDGTATTAWTTTEPEEPR